MKQLRMIWENDHRTSSFPVLPPDISVKPFTKLNGALSAWQDIMRFLGKDGDNNTGGDYYKNTMLDYPNYKEDLCFFILVDEKPAATITVICDKNKKQG